MDTLIVIAAFAPLLLLIWALVRYASRIRRDAVDKESRTRLLEDLNPALVRFVLERDRHTCQRCGTTRHVGVDFIGDTPGADREITASSLEASCAGCFLTQWTTLRDTHETGSSRREALPTRR